MTRENIMKEYSNYVRSYSEKNPPQDWHIDLFGKFPGTPDKLKRYFGYIMEKNVDKNKISAIEKRYKLDKNDTVEKKVFDIDGRTRSIIKFFNKKTVPYEKNLNFIALVFDVPINTFNDFINNYKTQKKSTTKKTRKKDTTIQNKPKEKIQEEKNIKRKEPKIEKKETQTDTDTKPHSVYNFFNNKTVAYEKQNFVPLSLNVPVNTFSDFPNNYEPEKNLQEKQPIEKTTKEKQKTPQIEIEKIQTNTDNIVNNKIVPYKENQNFVPLLFNAPVNTFNSFTNNHEPIKSQEKQPIKKEITIIDEKTNEKQKTEEKNTQNTHQKEIKEQNIQTNTNMKIPQKETKTKIKSRKKLVLFSSFLAIVIVAFMFFNLYASINNFFTENDNNTINSFMPVDVGDKLFDGEVIPVTNTADTGLSFHTFNIFNDKCLSKNQPWSFEVDKENGEDMNSQYGIPYNEDITTYLPTLNGRTTIANQKMELHFNITNNSDKNLYLKNMKLKVLKTYDAVAEQCTYNLYIDRAVEQVFSITLSDKNLYGFTMETKKIKPDEAMFFKCIITGDEKCNGLIYRYEIVADLIDTQGNHYEVKSDKEYLIGFLNED